MQPHKNKFSLFELLDGSVFTCGIILGFLRHFPPFLYHILGQNQIFLLAIASGCIGVVYILLLLLKKEKLNPLMLFYRAWPVFFGMVWLKDLLAPSLFGSLIWLCFTITAFALHAASLCASSALLTSLRQKRVLAPRIILRALIGIAIAYALIMALLPYFKYMRFYTYWMDFGYMIHPIYNIACGRLFEYTQLDGIRGNSLGDHFSLIFLFIAPFYKLLPSAYTLFALEALMCSLGGVFIYLIARSQGMRQLDSIALFCAFLAFAPLQYGILSEFHAEVLSVAFIAGMLWALTRNKYLWLWIFFILAILCKEHMGLVCAPLLIAFAFKRKNWAVSCSAMALLGILYTVIVQTRSIPYFNHGQETLAVAQLYPGGENGIGGVIHHALAYPQEFFSRIISSHNAEQLVFLFLPLCLIPLATPFALSLVLMLFKELYGSFAIHNHHQAYMAPIIFWCAILVWGKMSGEAKKIIPLAILIGCLLMGAIMGDSPLSIRFYMWWPLRYAPTKHAAILNKAVHAIPKNVSVSADSHIAVHLCDRRNIAIFPTPLPKDTADYIVVDVHYYERGFEIQKITWKNQTRDDVLIKFFELRQSGRFEKFFEEDGVFILKKKK